MIVPTSIDVIEKQGTVAKQLALRRVDSTLEFGTTIRFYRRSIEGEIMKKQIVGTLVTGLFLALMMAVPVHAQLPGTSLRANIPFDFIVRGKTLSAGTYEIKRISDSPGGLIITNIAYKHEHAMFETEPVEVSQPPRHGEIVFHRYGDDYFLSEVLPAGEETGSELMESRAERHLQRELFNNQASNRTEPETVAIVVY